jgi:hypothetical protein
MCAFAADQPGGIKLFLRAIGVAQSRQDVCAILLKLYKLRVPLDLTSFEVVDGPAFLSMIRVLTPERSK